jgi:hypothetical protein
MRKTVRITIRTYEEVRDKLKERAYENESDSVSREANKILCKDLGIKRGKKS